MNGGDQTQRIGAALLDVAEELDGFAFPRAGVVRVGGRVLLAFDPDGATGRAAGGCRGCGAALTYPGRGRPRQWCGESCRRRHRP